MPNIKSSKKDVLSSKIAYEKNKANKSALKTVLKKYEAALVSGDKAAAEPLTPWLSRLWTRLSTRVFCTRTMLPARRAA